MELSKLTNLMGRGIRASSIPFSMFLLLVLVFVDCRPASAIPAFARKYGMPCSSCHEAWPKLSPFGQQFKDNGYQMGNDRDAPIFQNPAYWPATFRITPIWHRESTDKGQVDGSNGPGVTKQRLRPTVSTGAVSTSI